AFLRTIKRFRGAHSEFLESGRLRHRVSIKCRILYNFSVPRPKSDAAHFVRVRIFHKPFRPRPLWPRPPRKPRYRQIKTSPEKMHRTAFPDESGTKLPENVVDAHQNLPKAMCVLRIIRRVALIQSEPHRTRHFHRH